MIILKGCSYRHIGRPKMMIVMCSVLACNHADARSSILCTPWTSLIGCLLPASSKSNIMELLHLTMSTTTRKEEDDDDHDGSDAQTDTHTYFLSLLACDFFSWNCCMHTHTHPYIVKSTSLFTPRSSVGVEVIVNHISPGESIKIYQIELVFHPFFLRSLAFLTFLPLLR